MVSIYVVSSFIIGMISGAILWNAYIGHMIRRDVIPQLEELRDSLRCRCNEE